jgi:hypothetical protein
MATSNQQLPEEDRRAKPVELAEGWPLGQIRRGVWPVALLLRLAPLSLDLACCIILLT